MKYKAIIPIILSILIVIGGLIVNFQEFLMGSPATIKNLIVTFIYLTIWILILTISAKNKSHGLMKYYSVFWILTMFAAIITGYVNFTNISVYWALPFAILLLGQWYGINFIVGSYLTASIIIALISLVMFIISTFSHRNIKQS